MATKRHVAFFEFTVWEHVIPLVSGLLEAAALRRPHVSQTYTFSKHSYNVRNAPVDRILEIEADIYAFSCYVWNTGLVRRLWPAVLAAHPGARIILGGPQVMHKGSSYLRPDREQVVICNGEGEITFVDYLEELLRPEPDLSRVNGLSFYRDGELVVTPAESRIRNFDEYPSPYLENLFAGQRFVYGVIETNRGCPFKCTYCYWGASTNSAVRQYPRGRVFEEIEWLSRKQVYMILIADANFGMLGRDKEIAEHIAACKAKYGYPSTVSFSASKNTPAKNAQVVKVFSDARLLNALPIAIQSTNPEVLERVERSNISSSGYVQLQNLVNERNQSSYVELIWPLPGETLESFTAGVTDLFRAGASTFNVYPLLLINNVKMDEQRVEFGLITTPDEDPNSEAFLVIATNDVTRAEYFQGLRHICHITSLLSCRGLALTARYLDATGRLSIPDLVARFDRFCCKWGPHPYTDHVDKVASSTAFFSWGMLGSVFHIVAGRFVRDFDQLLGAFLESLGLAGDDDVALAIDLDLLNRPYAYRNTHMVDRRSILRVVRILHVGDHDGITVEVPAPYAAMAARLLSLEGSGHHLRYDVRYKTEQYPYIAGKPDIDHHTYCTGLLLRMNAIAAQWIPAEKSGLQQPSRQNLYVAGN